MRLLIFFGVYEAEKSFAAQTVDQLLDLFRDHEVDFAIQDDASPSRVGEALVKHVGSRAPTRLHRIERSLGFHGMSERSIGFLERATQWGQTYDYVLRVDADMHFTSSRLAEVFAPGRAPPRGIFGPMLQMRPRDFTLVLADLVPFGFRRRVRDGLMAHKWEPRRFRPTWWHDIGARALLNGFRGRIVPGSLEIFAWPTVLDIASRGWLSRERTATGLVFQDDVLATMMVTALGDPVIEIGELVPGFRYDLFVQPSTAAKELEARGLDLVHPLKDTPWAHALRRELKGVR